jgi:arylsulfatase A-like enzyme
MTIRDLQTFYYGQIAAVDDWVAKVLESLHDQGLDENTIVLFSADHGDLFGSHHRFNKNELYDEASRIPFLIRWSGTIKPVVNDDQMIGQVDVMPSFLDLCGAERPTTTHGTSLAPVLLGTQKTAGENVQYIETTGNEGVRTPRYVYWCSRRAEDREHLFDTHSDPYEVNDVIADPRYSAVAQDLRLKTRQWRERTPSYRVPKSMPAAVPHSN